MPVAGFIAGFLTSRFTMTKKDRADVDQKNFENTATLIDRHDTAYTAATAASLDGFTEIATKGDRYLVQRNFLAAAVISGRVDPHARDTILLPKIRAAVRRTLPQHYDTMRGIAEKHGFPYHGELRRSDYAALYDAVERFGVGSDWEDGSTA